MISISLDKFKNSNKVKYLLFIDCRYEQLVEEPFHISKACIEPSTSKGITSVFIEVDDEEFIICNLTDKILNENLDLNFNFGDKIVFRTSVSNFQTLFN